MVRIHRDQWGPSRWKPITYRKSPAGDSQPQAAIKSTRRTQSFANRPAPQLRRHGRRPRESNPASDIPWKSESIRITASLLILGVHSYLGKSLVMLTSGGARRPSSVSFSCRPCRWDSSMASHETYLSTSTAIVDDGPDRNGSDRTARNDVWPALSRWRITPIRSGTHRCPHHPGHSAAPHNSETCDAAFP